MIFKEPAGNNIRFLANRGQANCGSYLAGLGASSGWYSKSPKPGASALRLDSDAEAVGSRPESSRCWRLARLVWTRRFTVRSTAK